MSEAADNSQPHSDKAKPNYREKNLEHIEKLKEKRQREIEDREKEERRDQAIREKLRRKVLEEAYRVREAKEKENARESNKEILQVPDSAPKKQRQTESLPKVNQISESQNEDRQKHKNRYMSFLTNLSEGLKQKKQAQEQQKRRKQQQYLKLKEQLGVNKVQSKLAKMMQPKKLARSQSAEKLESSTTQKEQQKNATTKAAFRDKNTEYIQKIKKRRQQQLQAKEQQQKRKQKMKERLKQYVMTTVKQNVLDGMYDDELDRKKKSKKELPRTEDEEENQQDGASGSDSEPEEQSPKEKKKKKKMRALPHITDLAEWKKKNRLAPETKVFIVTGGYPDVKRALRARGWVENPGHSSPCFDLKWTLQGREIDYGGLYENQIVNHYEKNGVITTKVGLCRSLRNMHWVCNIDQDEFYPKCFDLNDDDDYNHFEQYFKICKAQSILKLYMKLYGLKSQQQLQKIKPRAKVALDVCQRNIIDIDEIIDKKKNPALITAKQWEILAQDELNAEDLAKKKHEDWLHSIDAKYNERPAKKKTKKKSQAKGQKQTEQQTADDMEKADDFTKSIYALLQEYQKRFPQFTLIDIYNIWILKPAGLSRGRGITCYNNFVQIKDHIKSKQSLWVAQKYIQNPLIVCKRKFDIRQWVLVTDFNPLIIWYYEQCYVRFSILDYNAEDVNNRFVHLTNNAIASLHKDFDNSEIKGSMFSMEQFGKYLMDKEGYDVLNQKIKPQMKDIVKWSLQSAQEFIENRKNSHEMFGYDFMIDEYYHVWLIEINSSPSMDYSTHITERLVKQGLQDTVKVITDYNFAPKKLRKTIDTGDYKMIFKGIEIPEKPITTGLNLNIEGIPMKKQTKKATVKPKVFKIASEEEPQSVKSMKEHRSPEVKSPEIKSPEIKSSMGELPKSELRELEAEVKEEDEEDYKFEDDDAEEV